MADAGGRRLRPSVMVVMSALGLQRLKCLLRRTKVTVLPPGAVADLCRGPSLFAAAAG